MRKRIRKHAEEEEFELNLASIIDCFTVLITYLLVSASFISIGVLDVNIATPSPSSESTPEPKVSLSIQVEMDRNISVRLTGEDNKQISVPPKDGRWDYDGLLDAIKPLKDKWPELNEAVVAATPDIEYQEVVKAVEVAKKVVPVAYLGDQQVGI
jgi:biopolymer transport protein ExbD